MCKQIVCSILILLAFAISLVGCGSENSGSILLSSPTSANGVVTAEAIYAPSSGSVLPHQKITFFWRTIGKSSNIIIDYPPVDSYTDGTGKASSDLTLPSPRTEVIIVYVKASTGDLSTGMQSVEVAQ